MAETEEDGSNWLLELGLMEDLPSLEPNAQWPSTAFSLPNNLSSGLDDSYDNSDSLKDCGSKKRARSGACASDSKAHREKMRRDKLNDRFQELSSILEPGKQPKMDKSVILSDAVRMVVQLRDEAQKLKESYDNLQEKVNELKAEKNELRDEKQKLKAEKDKLEQQLKTTNAQPGFLPHPPAMASPFSAPHQVYASKMMPYLGYPGIPMWQFVPPAAVDTSEDHALRPPVA
ncbi:transcription factor ILR3-like [Nicotiana tomentosiformis]|uniref:transcription factor ILR3-like n=1 Tax=Nicotiana tomentosiformis TaxID=4098 RepID=UPI00051B2A82|nr:transcription factor ILR3-like [Nicotiana tomentosiformis]